MKKILLLCGVISPLIYIGMTILGGTLIPGYSHIKDTVSELMSPGAPNKALMDTLMTLSSVFMTLFGFGILQFIKTSGQSNRLGFTASILIIVLGIVQVVVVLYFPQDPMGTELTFQGKMHIGLVAAQALMSILIPLFIGLWLRRAGIMPGYGIYSIVSAALTVVMGIAIFPLGTEIMGLTERMTVLIYDLWMIIIAVKLFFQSM